MTKPLDIFPGLGIWPVSDPRHQLGIATVMDDILATEGWDVRVGTPEWLTQDRNNLRLT